MNPRRVRNTATVLLAVVSGASDAIGFLALGGAFTSVMTGNMVLLGISAGRLDGELAGHTIAALACFMLGCVAGTRLAGRAAAGDAIWPPAITRALFVEAGALAAYAIAWWASGSHPSPWLALCLLVINAFALGIQSSAVLRFGVPGLSTTYLTGTLTTLVHRLVSGHRLRELEHSVFLLTALVTGAAAAALLLRYAPAAAPVPQLAALALVLGLARLVHGGERVSA